MNIDKAEDLAMCTDYAVFGDDAYGQNKINQADAGAFFLEGYKHAIKEVCDLIVSADNTLYKPFAIHAKFASKIFKLEED